MRSEWSCTSTTSSFTIRNRPAHLLTAFEVSASIGLGLVVAAASWQGQPTLWVGSAALLFVIIGVRTLLNRPDGEAVLEHRPHKSNKSS